MTSQALPEHVRRQVEEAEALEKQIYGEAAPAPEEGNTDADSGTTVDAAPEPAAEEPVRQVVQPEAAPEEDTYRRRYDVLQGKYNAEIPRLHAQVRELTDVIKATNAELDKLRSAPPKEQTPDRDAEAFGEDLTAAIDRRAKAMAKELFEAESKPMVEYIQKLEARLGGVDQQVAISVQEQFLGSLARHVPDYEAVNADPRFLDWLGEVDPIYGIPRQEALNHASSVMDVERTANIFKAYKQLTGKQVQAPAQAELQRSQARQTLERQVAPSASRSSAAAPAAGKIWTREEFERAQDPRTIRELGVERANALAAEADLAYAEGRVQW